MLLPPENKRARAFLIHHFQQHINVKSSIDVVEAANSGLLCNECSAAYGADVPCNIIDSAWLLSDRRDDKYKDGDGGIYIKVEVLEADIFEQNLQTIR